MTTEITLFSQHTTLAIVAEAVSVETKILTAESEKALVVVEALVLREVLLVSIVLTVLIMLLKIKITASSKHDMQHFLTFQIMFRMSIYMPE